MSTKFWGSHAPLLRLTPLSKGRQPSVDIQKSSLPRNLHHLPKHRWRQQPCFSTLRSCCYLSAARFSSWAACCRWRQSGRPREPWCVARAFDVTWRVLRLRLSATVNSTYHINISWFKQVRSWFIQFRSWFIQDKSTIYASYVVIYTR